MVVLFALAALAAVGLLAGVHWYVWRRLIRDTTAPDGLPRRAGTVAAFALPVTSFAALAGGRAGLPFTLERVLAWPGYLWLAVLLYVTLALLVGEAVRPLLTRWLARRDARIPDPGAATAVPGAAPVAAVAAPVGGEAPAPGDPVPDPSPSADTPADAPADPPADLRLASRRLFVARGIAAGAAAVAAGTVGYGTYTVMRGPRLKHVTVTLRKLPRSAHGFRIAVVSDIHLGPILGRSHTERVVHTVNRAGADVIAVVGDLVDGSVADLGPAAEPLRRLSARHGAFFVTGNHEYFSGAREWVEHVRELGLVPLENERRELPGFDLAGVNDISGEDHDQGPDYGKALGGRDPARASVLLAHQPVMIHEARDHGVDLQLSGHTHGGQLWPGNYVAELANPTVAGLDRYGDTQLYVTRGAGAWGPPVRVGAPPDVTVVELASGQA